MVLVRALQWERRLTNRRGVVFLLSVYFASLLLLILSGIAIQRTMIETRAGQISRDLQQVFFLAEAAVDSALANIRTTSLLEGTPYYHDGLQGPLTTVEPQRPYKQDVASFTLQSLSGGEVLSNGQQIVQRSIVATATTSSGKQADVLAYYEEIGPVDGIWANGVIIIHGGFNPEDIIATGGMHSGLGAIATTVDRFPQSQYVQLPSRNGLLDLIDNGKRYTGLALDGAAYVRNLETLETAISPELKAIKNGYKCREFSVCVGQLEKMEFTNNTYSPPYEILAHPISSTIDEQDGTIPGPGQGDMDYHNPPTHALSIPYSKTLARVEGDAALGAVQQLRPVQRPSGMSCPGILRVPSGVGLTIGDGNSRDIGWGDGKVTLCVQAIVPEEETFVIDALVDNPPQVTFTAPATVFVTGAKHYNFSATIPGTDPPQPRFRVYALDPVLANYGRQELNGRGSFPAAMGLSFAGMQRDLYLSVGATIHAPYGLVEIVVTDLSLPNNPDGRPRHSLVRVRPGAQFVGSIYAPESLVAVAPREQVNIRHDAAGEVIPYHMKSIVGHDVIVELQGDRIKLGWDTAPNQAGPRVNSILGWVEGTVPSAAASGATPQPRDSTALTPPFQPACSSAGTADCY